MKSMAGAVEERDLDLRPMIRKREIKFQLRLTSSEIHRVESGCIRPALPFQGEEEGPANASKVGRRRSAERERENVNSFLFIYVRSRCRGES